LIWNASVADAATPTATVTQILGHVRDTLGRSSVVLLMHDTYGKNNTAAALPKVIEMYEDSGFVFKTLN